jgi:hypothetical protein
MRYKNGQCIPCHKQAEANRQKQPDVKARQRNWRLKKKYGITESEYQERLVQQQNVCAICKRSEPLRIDHNHTTGKIRGLLCHACNVAIGFLGEDPIRIYALLDYLGHHAAFS